MKSHKIRDRNTYAVFIYKRPTETMGHIYKHTVLLRNKYSRLIKKHTNCAEIVLALDYRRLKLFLNYIYDAECSSTALSHPFKDSPVIAALLRTLLTRSIE